MELSEAADRILRAHRKLILAMGMAGALVAFLLHFSNPTTYTATTRFVLDSTDLSGQTSATGIADTASAVATSPTRVARALRQIGAHRDPTTLAGRDVHVQTLGTSGVLRLSVTDVNPKVAVGLAKALTADVIAVTSYIINGRAKQTLDGLSGRIEGLTARIEAADGRISSLTSEIAATTVSSEVTALDATRTDLVQVRDELARSRILLQSERANVAATDAARPQAALIQPATQPVTADPGNQVPATALGALLGLFVGVVAATVIEILHPTVAGGSSMVRELGVPLLGRLPAPPEQLIGADVAEVAARVGFATSSAGVDHLQLIGAPGAALEHFALLLQDGVKNGFREHVESDATAESSFPRHRSVTGAAESNGNSRANFTVDVVGGSRPSRNYRTRMGLLLVIPTAVPRSQLAPIEYFVSISRWPVIGVIGYSRSNSRLRSRGATHPPDGTLETSEAGGGE